VAVTESRAAFFRAGETILRSGIYRVYHADHRLNHELTLLVGEVFPRCEKCGDAVQFELVTAASLDTGIAFRVKLYQVPHPVEEDEQADARGACG
jgi:hypothetical protein